MIGMVNKNGQPMLYGDRLPDAVDSYTLVDGGIIGIEGYLLAECDVFTAADGAENVVIHGCVFELPDNAHTALVWRGECAMTYHSSKQGYYRPRLIGTDVVWEHDELAWESWVLQNIPHAGVHRPTTKLIMTLFHLLSRQNKQAAEGAAIDVLRETLDKLVLVLETQL